MSCNSFLAALIICLQYKQGARGLCFARPLLHTIYILTYIAMKCCEQGCERPDIASIHNIMVQGRVKGIDCVHEYDVVVQQIALWCMCIYCLAMAYLISWPRNLLVRSRSLSQEL